MTHRIAHLSSQGASAGTLFIIITDFGADCDDQKAISQLISQLVLGDQLFVIVSGPHPRQASNAIAQAYLAKTGKYPVVALGQQFEAEKVPEEKIFSLINGNPMESEELYGFQPVALEEMHNKIDEAIKCGTFSRLQQCVLGPLHTDDEYYNPSSRLPMDRKLVKYWRKLKKTAVVQFQRVHNSYSGNNFQKSRRGVPDRFNKMLSEQEYARIYFDGSVAKIRYFLFSVRQLKLYGIERAALTYMENLQVPWASMPGKPGTTPQPGQMRVSMFTAKGEVPFGVHVAGTNPQGFGMERLAGEVCGLLPKTMAHKKMTKAIDKELNRFDNQVLRQFNKAHSNLAYKNVASMRYNMHVAMMDALQKFGECKRVPGPFASFKQLFILAEENRVKLNQFTYMDDLKKILFQNYPHIQILTSIAQKQAALPRGHNKSHLDEMTSILRGYGARAVIYDAVALAAAHTLEKHPELAAHFAETDRVHNITQTKVSTLKKSDPNLYRKFIQSVRGELEHDGGALAIETESLESICDKCL